MRRGKTSPNTLLPCARSLSSHLILPACTKISFSFSFPSSDVFLGTAFPTKRKTLLNRRTGLSRVTRSHSLSLSLSLSTYVSIRRQFRRGISSVFLISCSGCFYFTVLQYKEFIILKNYDQNHSCHINRLRPLMICVFSHRKRN